MVTIINEIKQKANIDKAKILARFFKTGKEEYGEGDLFLGITVPVSRMIAKKYTDLSLQGVEKLLKNKYHEIRLIALLILVQKYRKAGIGVSSKQNMEMKKEIVYFYLKNTKYINNWDLVDLSAHYIIGDYLYYKTQQQGPSSPKILFKLVKSQNLWERRIAIISTFAFIYKGESKYTFEIVKILMKDKHDLIHKACGWMLREVGKRVSETELTIFLDKYGTQMPRTMLRYAIERLPEKKRMYYLYK
jgi:3-methyladenine DNA glycosylase AlkD